MKKVYGPFCKTVVILLKKGFLPYLFLGKTKSYSVKVYIFCNFRLNIDPSLFRRPGLMVDDY